MTYAEKLARYGAEKVREQKRKYYQANKEKHKAAVYAFRANDKEKWLRANRAYQQSRAIADPNYWRKKSMRSRYGLSWEEYESRLREQNNRCAICRVEFSNIVRKCIDHNHDTLMSRGILCDGCNVGIAMFRENPDIMRTAIAYLAEHQVQRERLSGSASK